MPKFKMVCSRCGGENVMRDAWAEWDVGTQEWVLQNVFDASFCEDCDGEENIDEVEIEEQCTLPDGTEAEWDERLRTVGALRDGEEP